MTSVGKQWFDIRNQILGNNREACNKDWTCAGVRGGQWPHEEMHSAIIVRAFQNKILCTTKRKLHNQSSSCVGKFTDRTIVRRTINHNLPGSDESKFELFRLIFHVFYGRRCVQ